MDIFKEYKFPKKKIPENQIFTIENFIDDNLCDDLIKVIDEYANQEEKWGNNTNVNCKFINVENIANKEIKDKYDKIIFEHINKFVQILNVDYNISSTGDSGYCLRKIYGPTRFHKDGISVNLIENRYVPFKKIRNMSVIIALNDNYEGGEFNFINQNFKIKLKKGQLIAFPPYWTHIHGVEDLKNNTYRYTINTWLFE
jgi:hypothetical protein